MSKIYEALRRAEMDRAALENKDAAVEQPAAPAAVLETWTQPDVESISVPPQPLPPERPQWAAAQETESLANPQPLPPQRPRWAAAQEMESLSAQPQPVAPQRPQWAAAQEMESLADPKPLPIPPAPARVVVANVPPRVWTPSLRHLPALQTRGRAVEQFRSLRSRMQEFRDLNTLKSILISSGLPQEGKTFIAVNLAISFARHKSSRVLLIDGDMRRSSLHHLLGCASEPGLTDFLSGDASVQDILQRPNTTESGLPENTLDSLTFIGAGKDSDKAADLSGNHRFEELIASLSPMFDWIVVDSSPVNLVADAANLSRACDGVLLVARGGVTKFEAAQRATAELKAANILGFVLNAVTDPVSSNGYYAYDGYETYDSLEK